MTERSIRQDISKAEKELARLEKQQPKLERLLAGADERLSGVKDAEDVSRLLKARMERDTARQMVEENQREQEATRERITQLMADAEKAMLAEEADRTIEALQAAKNEWRNTAEKAARTFQSIMDELEAKSDNISERYKQASAAAVAARGTDEGVTAATNWGGLPGVNALGSIESSSKRMSVPPPMFKLQWEAAGNALNRVLMDPPPPPRGLEQPTRGRGGQLTAEHAGSMLAEKLDRELT